MRIPISLFTIALSCVLSQAASINWTNHVANIQAETNGYFGTSVNVGAGFADARIYPDSGPAVTPFRLQSTALRLSGNIFEVSNGPGFLILSLDYTGLLSAPDLLLTGDAEVQGTVRAGGLVSTNSATVNNLVATNGVYIGGSTNTGSSVFSTPVPALGTGNTNIVVDYLYSESLLTTSTNMNLASFSTESAANRCSVTVLTIIASGGDVIVNSALACKVANFSAVFPLTITNGDWGVFSFKNYGAGVNGMAYSFVH